MESGVIDSPCLRYSICLLETPGLQTPSQALFLSLSKVVSLEPAIPTTPDSLQLSNLYLLHPLSRKYFAHPEVACFEEAMAPPILPCLPHSPLIPGPHALPLERDGRSSKAESWGLGRPVFLQPRGTARKREESRAFHGYNKSKGEVGAGEITNFPSLGTGTCQAAAWGTHSLPSFLLPLQPASRSLLKPWHLTYPKPPPQQPSSLISGARHP